MPEQEMYYVRTVSVFVRAHQHEIDQDTRTAIRYRLRVAEVEARAGGWFPKEAIHDIFANEELVDLFEEEYDRGDYWDTEPGAAEPPPTKRTKSKPKSFPQPIPNAR